MFKGILGNHKSELKITWKIEEEMNLINGKHESAIKNTELFSFRMTSNEKCHPFTFVAINLMIALYFTFTLVRKTLPHTQTALLFKKTELDIGFIQTALFSHCEWQVNRH